MQARVFLRIVVATVLAKAAMQNTQRDYASYAGGGA